MMSVTYDKVWEVMNDLEENSSKLISIRELLKVISDSCSDGNYERVESLSNATLEYLDFYIQEYDKKFTRAWNNTVGELKREEEVEKIRESNYGFGQSLDKESVNDEFNDMVSNTHQ